ncbi:MAG: ATP-binding protein [Bacteroidales bacterium]|nr:MAG: ATP-binding protein [Bacteroidales bacterium]
MGKIKRPIIQTTNFNTVRNVCYDSLTHQHLNIIYSPPGYGKTLGLTTIKMEYPENVVYIKALASDNPRVFYSSIINELVDEKYNWKLSLSITIKRAASLFNSKDKNMILLIDEVTKFNHNFFLHLHDFRELTMDSTGIVLSGGKDLKERFEKWCLHSAPGISEFVSRFNIYQQLFPPSKDEIVTILHANNIFDKDFEKKCIKEVTDFRQLETYMDNYDILKEKLTNEKLKIITS